MDYSYFLNDEGKYTAKRLPSPKNTPIKLKDISDISGLRYDLVDYKPKTESQFIDIYNNTFNSIFSYDIEVECFETTILKNSGSHFNGVKEIKRYFQEILNLYDPDELVEEYDWIAVDTGLANALKKANLAKVKDELDDDDWVVAFNKYKKIDLQTIAKPIGIKVSQTKESLIDELVKYQLAHNNLIEAPVFIKFNSSIGDFFSELQRQYISFIDLALADYPRAFQATVWDNVADANDEWLIVFESSSEKLALFTDVEGVGEEDSSNSFKIIEQGIEKAQFITTADLVKQQHNNVINAEKTIKLDRSLIVIFDYIDSTGSLSNREFRLDMVVINEHTYLHGFCFKRTAARDFRLDRIKSDITIKETGEIISPNEFIYSVLPEHDNIHSDLLIDEKSLITKFEKNNIKHKIKPNKIESNDTIKPASNKFINVLFWIGVFIAPYIFAWFTLRKGSSTKSKYVSFGWLLIFAIAYFSSPENKNTADLNTANSKTELIDKKTSDCQLSLACLAEKHIIYAGAICQSPIQKMSQYSYEWTDGFATPRFSHYRWVSQSKGIITYIGDEIKLQNGFGAWAHYTYECDFDTAKQSVIDVRATQGRIK